MIESAPPFTEGQIVRIIGNEHLGYHRVYDCRLIDRTSPGVAPSWRVYAIEIREPIDWSKIPSGATGIVLGASWEGPSDSVELKE